MKTKVLANLKPFNNNGYKHPENVQDMKDSPSMFSVRRNKMGDYIFETMIHYHITKKLPPNTDIMGLTARIQY